MVSPKNKPAKPIILDANTVRSAEIFLSQKDPIISDLIQIHGPCTIYMENIEPFVKLVSSIIGQQLSVKAARTIRERVFHHLREITPSNIIATDDGVMRSCGLSIAKIGYIKNLSQQVESGTINFSILHELPTEMVIKELTKVKGVGQWTAEMFSLFTLRHSNILSLGDAGLKRAVKKLYGDMVTLEKLLKIGNLTVQSHHGIYGVILMQPLCLTKFSRLHSFFN